MDVRAEIKNWHIVSCLFLFFNVLKTHLWPPQLFRKIMQSYFGLNIESEDVLTEFSFLGEMFLSLCLVQM